MGLQTYILDGDNVRMGLNKDLGFSPEDRTENIRRITEVAKLFADSGSLVLTAFISPYRNDRDNARDIISNEDFIEIFVSSDLSVCESRDPKGLYKKARSGEIKGFTGIDAPYEEPINPELTVHTDKYNIEECAQIVVDYLINNNIINK
jgi:adenylylsulfate kinase